ncbi:SMI1/KNR4 family protein [Hymenobacter sp. GOD-10R]|uniref:SMI1/KNR4 family protein n=1 Tax=Hymenobacter sp. GOD-10R TaxID=3093922 RepID=UPI002D7905FF|nr:SMI1/KNR4 family protein [Hymenobacter sp. GOD-10R]WRQ28153.1 SMI1/KNR4 family protein [Hymenobacter sp. GOD-10R]
MQVFYSQLKQFLTAALETADAIGCSEEEITYQERAYDIQFPLAYRLFLIWCGKTKLSWMNGRDFGLDTLAYSWDSATELLAENQSVLEPNGFVFSEWQGYNFWYFLQGIDNPPVKLCIIQSDVDPGLQIIEYGRFTDWLINQIKDSIKLKQSLKRIDVHVPTIWTELDRIAKLVAS